MASSATPKPHAFYLHHLILFSVLIFSPSIFEYPVKLVKADEQLIQRQCHNAEVPVVCNQCVKSDPKAQQADEKGIAAIVINCLSSHAQNLIGNMSKLASDAKEREAKSVFQECGKEFSQAKESLSTATGNLESGDYDKTNYFIRTALKHEVTCQMSLAKRKLGSSTVYEMRLYEELSDAAMRMVDRL